MLATRDWKISKISAARLIERLCRRRPAGGVENNNWAATPPLTIRRPANPLLPSRQRRPAQRMSLPIKRSKTWIIVTRQCRHQKAANDFFLQVHICTQSHTLSGIFKTVTFFPLLAMPLLWGIFFKELRLGMCSSRFCFFWHLRLNWKKLFPTKISLYSKYCLLAVDSDTDFLGILGLWRACLWMFKQANSGTCPAALVAPNWHNCSFQIDSNANLLTNQPTDQLSLEETQILCIVWTHRQAAQRSVERWF